MLTTAPELIFATSLFWLEVLSPACRDTGLGTYLAIVGLVHSRPSQTSVEGNSVISLPNCGAIAELCEKEVDFTDD